MAPQQRIREGCKKKKKKEWVASGNIWSNRSLSLTAHSPPRASLSYQGNGGDKRTSTRGVSGPAEGAWHRLAPHPGGRAEPARAPPSPEPQRCLGRGLFCPSVLAEPERRGQETGEAGQEEAEGAGRRAGRRQRAQEGWTHSPKAMTPARLGHGPGSLRVCARTLSQVRAAKPLGNEEVQPRLGWCRFAGQGAT